MLHILGSMSQHFSPNDNIRSCLGEATEGVSIKQKAEDLAV